MPLDQVHSYDYFYDRIIGTEYKFAWLPKLCHLSGKRIWLKKAYRLTRLVPAPEEIYFEYRWHSKDEHIIWKLTR